MFGTTDAHFRNCTFADGESPLKESHDLTLDTCTFGWKYPLWYTSNVLVKNSVWEEMARAGVWYTENVRIFDSMIEAPKNFRRCKDLLLENVDLPCAAETLWHCEKVQLKNVSAKGDYFAMNCKDMSVENLRLFGNYSFDGAKNITVKNSKLLSKDAFWNTENVRVEDSYISGEYLGWNAKNLTFINCTLESLQGLCYIENLQLINCKLINTTLAFEYCTGIDATVKGKVDSILNPSAGSISAEEIKDVIFDAHHRPCGEVTVIDLSK